ncbi:MAG: hypothetical protein M1821_005156 [Bathelium mastoideum]|nr:MAG: hypothetical protein M1821_005156 [Bathelium mastoideum]
MFTLLFYAALAFAILVTTVFGPALSKVEVFLLILYVTGFFAILIPLIRLAPHSKVKDVFNTFINAGGWKTQGLSFMVGLSGNAFTFLGADSIYHMSEEIRDAARVVPKAMVTSLVLSGVVGLGAMIAVVFCLGNIEEVLNTQFNFPFVQVFIQATNSTAGTAVMVAVIIVLDLGLVISCVAAGSRQLWSFSRDRGVPGWSFFSKINGRTTIPERSIIVTVAFSILIGLISIGSPVAFNDVVSLTLAALYASYFMACFLLLWRRSSGAIKASNLSDGALSDADLNLPGREGHLVWGPWHVPGIIGIIINAFGCVYLVVIFFFAFWPPALPVTPADMNYACLVFGFVAMISAAYYIFQARKTYHGPIVETL